MTAKLLQYTLDANNGVTTTAYIDVPAGSVTSVAALTIGTTGTDLTSSVANGTTTPVITLNVPTASASNRGALSSTDWSAFNAKQSAITFGTGVQTALGVNIGSAGAPVLFNGAGGTPASIVLTNATGTASALNIGGNAATANTAQGNTGSIGTGTPTTIFTRSTKGCYLVQAYITNGGTSGAYTASARAYWDGTSGRITSDDGASLTVSGSGADVIVTQNSGGNQTVIWSYLLQS